MEFETLKFLEMRHPLAPVLLLRASTRPRTVQGNGWRSKNEVAMRKRNGYFKNCKQCGKEFRTVPSIINVGLIESDWRFVQKHLPFCIQKESIEAQVEKAVKRA